MAAQYTTLNEEFEGSGAAVVTTTEPQPSPSDVEFHDTPGRPERRQRVDENGEVIIAEGVCSRRRICMQICTVYFALAILSCFIFLPFACFLGFYCGHKAATLWNLYLTPTGIHYTRVGASTCCHQKMFIPLEDIEDVWVQETIVVRHNGPTTHTHSIKVKIDQDKIEQYIPWTHRKIFMQTDYLELIYVENASDFANAIKRQMAVSDM